MTDAAIALATIAARWHLDPLPASGSGPPRSPRSCIDQAITVMDVRAALAQLKPEHREVIVEMYYLGQSVAEIATRLGIPEGTVKSRTYYGLRQLERLLSASSGEQAERAPAPFPRALAA